MVQYNDDKIRKVSSEINTALALLEELSKTTETEFIGDPHKVSSAKYNLIVAIEGTIDLCNHIISMNNWKTPEDYADSFRIMAEHGAFDESVLKRLIKMSRFRNRLVHIYWDVSSKNLHEIITSNIGDFRTFLDLYVRFTGCTLR